jgi:hypothetical protein
MIVYKEGDRREKEVDTRLQWDIAIGTMTILICVHNTNIIVIVMTAP